MKRVRINATAGKMVNAGGQWLTCIGNIPHRVGDFVWSDGRCAYGNLIESDDPVILPVHSQGIPIMLQSFAANISNNNEDDKDFDENTYIRTELDSFERSSLKNHSIITDSTPIKYPYPKDNLSFMLNDNKKFDFIQPSIFPDNNNSSNYRYTYFVYDAEFVNGDIYVLNCNKMCIYSYNNKKIITDFSDRIYHSLGDYDPEHALKPIPLSGFIDKNGDYYVSYWYIYSPNNNIHRTNGREVLFTPSNTFIIDGFNNHSNVEFLPFANCQIPIPDNWYYTFNASIIPYETNESISDNLKKMRTLFYKNTWDIADKSLPRYIQGYSNGLKIHFTFFDNHDRQRLEINLNGTEHEGGFKFATSHINILPTKRGTFLLQADSHLYHYSSDGERLPITLPTGSHSDVVYNCHNVRLRFLDNFAKWKLAKSSFMHFKKINDII